MSSEPPVVTEFEKVANSCAHLVTREGVTVHVCAARPGDEAELSLFFHQVAPADLRYRFFETLREVGPDRLAEMTHGAASHTFLARNDAGVLVAVATLSGEHGAEEAEVALSVAAEWKHKGISWTFLEWLLAYAKAEGFKIVSSLEAGENREAINLEREMGFIARLTSAAPLEILASKHLG